MSDAAWQCGKCGSVQVISVPAVSYNRIGPVYCKCTNDALVIPTPLNDLARQVEAGWLQMDEYLERKYCLRVLKDKARFIMNQPKQEAQAMVG